VFRALVRPWDRRVRCGWGGAQGVRDLQPVVATELILNSEWYTAGVKKFHNKRLLEENKVTGGVTVPQDRGHVCVCRGQIAIKNNAMMEIYTTFTRPARSVPTMFFWHTCRAWVVMYRLGCCCGCCPETQLLRGSSLRCLSASVAAFPGRRSGLECHQHARGLVRHWETISGRVHQKERSERHCRPSEPPGQGPGIRVETR
jgi:hypothetical protein